MKPYIILACLFLSLPFLTDWAVDRSIRKHPQPAGYTASEASELHRLQDAALHHKMTTVVRYKMTTGEKRAVLANMFGVQP